MAYYAVNLSNLTMNSSEQIWAKYKKQAIILTIWLVVFCVFQNVWTIPSLFQHSSNGIVYHNKDVALGAPSQYLYYVQEGGQTGGYQGLNYHPLLINLTANTSSPSIRLPFFDADSYIYEGYYIDLAALLFNTIFWSIGFFFLYKIPKKPIYIIVFILWFLLLLFLTLTSIFFLDVECIAEGSSCNG